MSQPLNNPVKAQDVWKLARADMRVDGPESFKFTLSNGLEGGVPLKRMLTYGKLCRFLDDVDEPFLRVSAGDAPFIYLVIWGPDPTDADLSWRHHVRTIRIADVRTRGELAIAIALEHKAFHNVRSGRPQVFDFDSVNLVAANRILGNIYQVTLRRTADTMARRRY